MFSSNSQLVTGLVSCGVLHTPTIKEALLVVDRKDFVIDKYKEVAYTDQALPIGYNQTISQPYTVAFLLEQLNPQAGETILDVGSGSGWTTALLSHIVGEKGYVFGVEIIPELVNFGRLNIAKYSYRNWEIVEAKDEPGLREHAPYDKILVSAGGTEVPPALLEQLKIGGVMVIPIVNAIWKITKISEADNEIEKFPGFVFVPLM